jgi:hypothetical protein
MAVNVSKPAGAVHLERLQTPRPSMAKADLNLVQMAQREAVGRVLQRVPQLLGLSDKEFAARIDVQPNQLSAWHSGTENAALWRYYRDNEARRALLIALSERFKCAKVTTNISIVDEAAS